MVNPTIVVKIASDTEFQFIGSIIGVLLGTLIGATASYMIGERARKKQKEIDEIKEQRQKVRAHEKAVVNAISEVQGLIFLILKNIEHYKSISAGIISENGDFSATISMPEPYPHELHLVPDFMNANLANKMRLLDSEIVLQNSNLNEFSDYYATLRSIAHEALLLHSDLNRQVLNRDNEVIIRGAKQNLIACESFKERCFALLAEIELGCKRWKSLDFTKVTISDLHDYMDKLKKYTPTDDAINNYTERYIRPMYKAENAFKIATDDAKTS